jgi:hypothetical protein
MNVWTRRIVQLALCTALACPLGALGDDDDDAAKTGEQPAVPALNSEQQHAVGLRVSRPVATKAPERIEALGVVLDATVLLSDESEVEVAEVQQHAASAELARLRELYKGGAGASLKMLETAQAEEAKALSEAQLASARFAQHWGPVAAEPPEVRRKRIDAVTAGRSLLVRADLPGRHILGTLPSKAVLDVDGIQIPGRVLGALRQFTELQSAGLLIEVQNAPLGLAPGARVPVSLLSAERDGLLLPRDALLYDESGVYVYKQVTAKTPGESTRYVPVKVTLLLPYGDGWLVRGVDDDDDIVVHGAGVLWSLEGMGAHAVDEDED